MRMFHKYHKNPSRPSKRTKVCNDIANCMRHVRISNPGKYDDFFQGVFGQKPKKGKKDDVMAEQEVYEAMLALDEEQLKLAQAKAKRDRRRFESERMRKAGRPAAAQAEHIAAMSAEEDIKSSRRRIAELEQKVEHGRYVKRPPAKQVKGSTKHQKGVIEDPWQTKEERRRARELTDDWYAYMSGKERRRKKSAATPTGAIYAVDGGAFRARIDPCRAGFCWTLYDPNNNTVARGEASTKGHASKAVRTAKDRYLMQHGVAGDRDVVPTIVPPSAEARDKERIYTWGLVERSSGNYITSGTATSQRAAERAAQAAMEKLALEEGKRERGIQRAEMVSRRRAKQFKRPFKPALGHEELREYDFPQEVVRKAAARKAGKATPKRLGKPKFTVKYRLGGDGWYGQIVMPGGKLSEEFGPYKKIEDAESRAKLVAGMMSGMATRVGEHLEGNPSKCMASARRGLSKISKKCRIKNPSVAERLGIDKAGLKRGAADEGALFNEQRLKGMTAQLDKYESDIFYLGYFYGVLDGIDMAGVQNYMKRKRIRKRAEKELFKVVRNFKVAALSPSEE